MVLVAQQKYVVAYSLCNRLTMIEFLSFDVNFEVTPVLRKDVSEH